MGLRAVMKDDILDLVGCDDDDEEVEVEVEEVVEDLLEDGIWKKDSW